MLKFNAETARETRDNLIACCHQMKGNLDALRDSRPGGVAGEVHAIRKLGKALRGGIELFGLKRSAGREIQAIGRLLSESRDAVSRLSTWNKLKSPGDPATANAIRAMLENQSQCSDQRPPDELIDWCHARVDTVTALLHALPEDNLSGLMEKGWKRLNRRAEKRLRKLDAEKDENFHEARKKVKALLGAAGQIPGDSTEPAAHLHDFAEELGDENDLATLSTWLRVHGFTPRFAPAVWEEIDTRRRRLHVKLEKCGASL